MNTEVLICPVCGAALGEASGALRCERGHSFDLAREGYVNLLTGSRPVDARGDRLVVR